MPEILITVRNKLPVVSGDTRTIVTDNSDYTIRFIFDEQWDESEKVVYLIRSNGYAYPPISTTDDVVEVPVQHKAGLGAFLLVGIQQGNIKTSAAAHIAIRASAIDAIDNEAVQPSAELWNAVLQRLRDVEESISPEELERIVNEYLKENPITESVKSVNGQTGEVKLNAADVGALPDSTQIPGKTSDLQNDSGFITRLVSDLTNYYTKNQTYSREEVDARVSAIPKFSISVVSSLPTSNISETTVYLVKAGSASGDMYTEYIRANGAWEILGSQRVDLTGYATKTWVNLQLADYLTADKLTEVIITDALGYTPAKSTDVPVVDDTLTKSGQAADAAIVGQKLTEQSEAIADLERTINGVKTWDYTEGLPEVDGYTYTGTAGKAVLKDNGVELSAGAKYHFPFVNAPESDIEFKFTITKKSSSYWGFVVIVSNGTKGIRLSMQNGEFYFCENTSNNIKKADISEGAEHTLKVNFHDTAKADVYLDGVKIIENSISYPTYTTTLFQQDGSGTTLLHSITYNIPEVKGDYIPVPETAAVGQTIVVESVDENGKPTAWKAEDLPSGTGGAGFALISDITTEEDVQSITVDIPDGVSEIIVYAYGYYVSGGSGFSFLKYDNTSITNANALAESQNWFYNNNIRGMYCHARKIDDNTWERIFNKEGFLHEHVGTALVGSRTIRSIKTITLCPQSTQFLKGFQFKVWVR